MDQPINLFEEVGQKKGHAFIQTLPEIPEFQVIIQKTVILWALQDLNLRPADYESAALTN